MVNLAYPQSITLILYHLGDHPGHIARLTVSVGLPYFHHLRLFRAATHSVRAVLPIRVLGVSVGDV